MPPVRLTAYSPYVKGLYQLQLWGPGKCLPPAKDFQPLNLSKGCMFQSDSISLLLTFFSVYLAAHFGHSQLVVVAVEASGCRRSVFFFSKLTPYSCVELHSRWSTDANLVNEPHWFCRQGPAFIAHRLFLLLFYLVYLSLG